MPWGRPKEVLENAKNFEHLNAASFEQATQELKSSKRGQPIAGGTDLWAL